MSYLKLYKETIIPNMGLEGLKEQKRLFEGQEHSEDKQIYQAICEKIHKLEEIEMLETLKN